MNRPETPTSIHQHLFSPADDEHIQQNPALLKQVAASVSDFVILIDLAINEVLYYNHPEFLGYPIPSAFGNDPAGFLTNLVNLDDKDPEAFLQQLNLMDDGEVLTAIYRVRNKQRKWEWIEEKVKIYRRNQAGQVSQLLILVQVVTEREETRLQQQTRDERYHRFMELNSEGIYYIQLFRPMPVDLPHNEQIDFFLQHAFFAECNQAMADMSGMPDPRKLAGRKVEDLQQRPAMFQQDDLLSLFLTSDYRLHQHYAQTVDSYGRTRHLQLNALGIVEEGYLIGLWGSQKDVTTERSATKALRDSEARLSNIINDTKVGIWEWWPRADQTIVNPNAMEMIGYPEQGLVHKMEGWEKIMHRDDFAAIQRDSQQLLNGEAVFYRRDIRIRTRDGGWKWIQIRGRISDRDEQGQTTRISGTLIDIDESKRAELLIKEGEDLLRLSLNTLPDLKLRVNQEGKVLAVFTPQQEPLPFSLRSEDMEGCFLQDFLPPVVAKGLLFNVRQPHQSGKLKTLEFVDSKQGTPQFYEARINAINEEEVMIVLRNITALKKAENDLTEKVRELDQKNRELQKYIESNLALENFAYIASHDLREPVRTMRSFAQILSKRLADQLDEDSQTYLGFISSSANQMNQLIEDLLTYSRVNTDPLDRVPIHLPDLLQDILKQMRNRIDETGAQIELDNIPDYIHGSPTRLRQLFQNLIANALKFRKPQQPHKEIQ
ncbi:MAG: PAS domain-containing protein [Lewinella sp.]|nr:PAS domain-containing protein [Lewinella sp.]